MCKFNFFFLLFFFFFFFFFGGGGVGSGSHGRCVQRSEDFVKIQNIYIYEGCQESSWTPSLQLNRNND